MTPRLFLSAAILALALLEPWQARTQPRAQAAPAAVGRRADDSHHTQQDEGERLFEQNCSRCHAAPDGFSPRISGTILRHMRVRASLSRHDEEEILRFLNP